MEMKRKRNGHAGSVNGIDRRELLHGGAAASIALAAGALAGHAVEAAAASAPAVASFELEEVTIAQLQELMRTGARTARSLAEAYVARIRALDTDGPALRSVIELNPDAFAIADALDVERANKGARGPLHGVPVLIKDNVATTDRMETTAGSLALVGAKPPRDAFIVARLRTAGAVIIGKTNLSEWANFRSTRSSSGWSGRGGQCRNPYALDRNPCGSSSGTGAAIAANFAAVGVGTETDGSIVCPSHACSLVGIKPTLGLVSRSGIVPIAHSQDTAGPMARTVADAAILLGVLTGEDERDAATASARGRAAADYARFLDPKGLSGARIGVARKKFFGYSNEADRLIELAVRAMAEAGAVIIDPADIPHASEYDDAENEVLLYELKADLNTYLAELGAGARVRTLKDVIAFNEQHHDEELAYFGQEQFLQSEKKGPLTEKAYRRVRSLCRKLSRTQGLDVAFAADRLNAIVAPTGSPAWPIDLVNGDHFLGASSTPAAVAGYPSITVPAGYCFGLPVGITFIGKAWEEGTLIRLAYAFEQATKHRERPRFLPTADLSSP